MEEGIEEEIATNTSSLLLQHLDVYGFFSFVRQLHSLIVKLALNTSSLWPQDSPANMKDPWSVPGVARLTLGVCVTERNQVGDADVYVQEQIQDPQAICKTKTEGQHKLC